MACPDSSCGLVIQGDNGVKTRARCNVITIKNLRNLSPYVVGSNDDAEFGSLCDAVKAANQDTTPGALSIFILPGTYSLCDELATTRKINFIGVSMGGMPSPKITGMATSYGNKGWNSVIFTGGTGQYLLDNPDAQTGAIDTFRNCQFTNNFQVTTRNDVLFFFDCFFNYGDLARNDVIEVKGGMGQLRIYSSRFFFSRLGSSTATQLLHFGGNTITTSSIIKDCTVTGVVDGSSTFVFAYVDAQQPVNVDNTFFTITAAGARGVLFGSSSYFTGAQILFEACTFIGPGGNVDVLGEVWSGSTSNKSITFNACMFRNIRVVGYRDIPPLLTPATSGFLRINNSTIEAPVQENAFLIVLSQNNVLEILMHGVVSIANTTMPLIQANQVAGATNTLTLRVTCDHFRNEAGVSPPWTQADIDVLNIFHESTSLSGYGVATNTGVLNDVVYSTTLS